MIRAAASWSICDLVIIGIIAALARALGLIAVFIGGGMNPISLALRAMITTSLFIVLRHKVKCFGTLALAALIGSLTSFFVMAQGIITLPFLLLAAFLAEIIICYLGKNRTLAIVAGVGLMQLMDKGGSLGFIYLSLRENPSMMWPLITMISLSGVGDLLGCLLAPGLVKELRHAGFIAT